MARKKPLRFLPGSETLSSDADARALVARVAALEPKPAQPGDGIAKIRRKRAIADLRRGISQLAADPGLQAVLNAILDLQGA